MDYKTAIEFEIDRLRRLRFELKLLAPTAFISIIIIEFCLNKIPAPSQFVYDLGVVYIKLCYSFVSAFIFYYLVVFSPKDRKKAKSFLIVSNTVTTLRREVTDLIRIVFNLNTIEEVESSAATDFETKGATINPQNPISVTAIGINSVFPNHYQYFITVNEHMTDRIRLLLPLYDIIDDEVFKGLTEILDIINSFFNFKHAIYANTDIAFLSHFFYDINTKSDKLSKLARKKYSGFSKQYHYFARQQNLAEMKAKEK